MPNEMIKIIHYLKTKFNRETETAVNTMKMGYKINIPVREVRVDVYTPLYLYNESSRRQKVRTWRKTEDLYQISKEYVFFKEHRKGTYKKCEMP